MSASNWTAWCRRHCWTRHSWDTAATNSPPEWGWCGSKGSFTAASARKLIRIIGSDIEDHDVVILDFSQTEYIDDTAALVVEHMIHTANTENTAVIILGLHNSVAKSLTGFGILRDVPSQCRVATIDQARELARTLLEDNSTEHTA